MKRDFILPEEDVEFLDSKNFKWETVLENGNQWLLLHDFEIPRGYNTHKVTAAIQITSGYPTNLLDMVYFNPWLSRLDGVHIGQADQPMQIAGTLYQRWSRHYEWKPGFHNVTTHILSIEAWLQKEFEIKPTEGVTTQ